MKYHSNSILLLFQCQVLFCWEFISFRNIEWTRIFSFVWMVWLFDICSSNGFSCGWNHLSADQSRCCLWKDTESSSPWRNEDAFEVFERYDFKVYLIWLKVDLRQDISRGFIFIWGFGKTQKRRFVFVTLLIWVNVLISIQRNPPFKALC